MSVNWIFSEFYMIGKVIPLLISQNILTIGAKSFDDIDSRKKLSTRMFFLKYKYCHKSDQSISLDYCLYISLDAADLVD
jgi:hypothetical protein